MCRLLKRQKKKKNRMCLSFLFLFIYLTLFFAYSMSVWGNCYRMNECLMPDLERLDSMTVQFQGIY